MFYKLYYFKKADSICANDLEEKNKIENINLSLVSSLSDLQRYHLPISGTFKGNYALLTMNNGDRYYINQTSFENVSEAIG